MPSAMMESRSLPFISSITCHHETCRQNETGCKRDTKKDTTIVLANPAHAKQTPALANSRPLVGLLHPHNPCTIRHPFLATLLFVFATLTNRPPAQPTAKNGMTLLHSVAEPPSATL